MNKYYKNTKIWVSTMEKLRELALLKKDKMIKIIDDLITEELNKQKKMKK